MKILITTGLSPDDIGGPFQYAPRLKEAFELLGYSVEIVSYGNIEKTLPPWIRHFYFLIKVLPKMLWSNVALSLDTYSTGVPTVILGLVLRKKIIVRIGGDYLWSTYVNRTGSPVTLGEFYDRLPKLNTKEKLIMRFLGFLITKADMLVFNTEWQRNIWSRFYVLQDKRTRIVRNFIPEKHIARHVGQKNFLWVGRIIPEKNILFLQKLADKISEKYPDFRLDIVTGKPHNEVLEIIKGSYAVVSATFTDICPNFIIEGISFNKPFIMTKETGLREIYPQGGIFVDPKDVQAWERSIETMLEDESYNSFIEELKGISPVHSWQDLAQEFIEIWKNL